VAPFGCWPPLGLHGLNSDMGHLSQVPKFLNSTPILLQRINRLTTICDG